MHNRDVLRKNGIRNIVPLPKVIFYSYKIVGRWDEYYCVGALDSRLEYGRKDLEGSNKFKVQQKMRDYFYLRGEIFKTLVRLVFIAAAIKVQEFL